MSPIEGRSRSAGAFGASFALFALAVMIAHPARAAGEAAPGAIPEGAESAKLSSAQLEELVAPISLYPDALAVQVLMAATYPLEIVEAARWRAKNSSLQGDALEQALESRNWDPSVESLTRVPDLLQRMSDNLDWTKDLGDAFLGQKDDVLDVVQRMRAKAYESGALKTTKEQVVTREIVKEKEIIRVEPADPQVVYVPTYSPDAVYGPPPTPYYPAMTGYPPGYVATASLLSFGAGMAVGAAVWGDCDWGHNEVNNYYNNGGGGGGNQNVNVNKNKEKNVNKSGNRTRGEGGRQKRQHNPEHRGGVPYRDQAVSLAGKAGSDRVPRSSRRRVLVGQVRDRTGAKAARSAATRAVAPRVRRARAAPRAAGAPAMPAVAVDSAAAAEVEEEEVGVASEAGAEEEAAVAVAVAVEAAEGADEDQHETRDPALPGAAARNGPRAGALPVPRGGGTRARGRHARRRSRAHGACPGPGERGDRLVGR